MIRTRRSHPVAKPAHPSRRPRRSRLRPVCETLEGRTLLSLFQGAINYPTPGGNIAVTLGEFRNDGNPDIVTSTGYNIVLLPGAGDGTFGTPSTFAIGTTPNVYPDPAALAVGDFYGDGNLDLVTANDQGNDVTLLRGNGQGSFVSQANFAVGNAPDAIAVGDLTGNGNLDVVTTNSGDNTISILMGDGHGSFAPAVTLPGGYIPDAVAIADLNHDGKPDIIVADAGSRSVSVYSNNGLGVFAKTATYKVGKGPDAVAVGDLNGNGRLDIVTADAGSNAVSVLDARSNGTYQPAKAYKVGKVPKSVALADLTGDGKLDIVTADFGTWQITKELTYTPTSPSGLSVLVNRGRSRFKLQHLIQTGPAPDGVAVGDVNHDGIPDLVSANDYGRNASVVLGRDGSNFVTSTTVKAGIMPYTVASGSFYRRTGADLVAAEPGVRGGKISVLKSLGDGRYARPQTFRTGSVPNTLAVGDFSGNGHDGIAWVNFASPGKLTVRNGLGGGRFGPARSYAVGDLPTDIAVGDLNGDGRPDIVTANLGSSNVSVLLNEGHGRFASAWNFTVGPTVGAVAIGDVTGDGTPDLVVAEPANGAVAVMAGNGDGTFRSPQTFRAGPDPTEIALADLTGDGRLDVITANQSTPDVLTVLMNLGNGQFGPPVNYTGPSGVPTGLVVGDFGGNGALDVAITITGAPDALVVFASNGDGTFQPGVEYAAGLGARGLAAGPFFAPGETDLAVGHLVGTTIDLFKANRSSSATA